MQRKIQSIEIKFDDYHIFKSDKDKKILSEKIITKPGNSLSQKTDKLFIQEANRLRRKDGRFYDEDLVKVAQNKKHPLHNLPGFVWDKDRALFLYNTQVVARVRNAIQIEVAYEKRRTREIKCIVIPVFKNRMPINTSSYERSGKPQGSSQTTELLDSQTGKTEILTDFALRLVSLIKRYEYIFEFFPEHSKELKNMTKFANKLLL